MEAEWRGRGEGRRRLPEGEFPEWQMAEPRHATEEHFNIDEWLEEIPVDYP